MKARRARQKWLLACFLAAATVAVSQMVPAPTTGEMPAAGFLATGKQTNVAVISFSSRSYFDDNFSNSASHHDGGGQQLLTATLGFQQTRQQMRWNLSYRPGVVVGAHSLQGNQFNQVLGTSFEAQPTARWSLKLRQDYSLSNDPFDRLGEAPLQPGLSPLEEPNQLPFLPELKKTASFTGAGASYRLSRHTTVGLNGSYALQNYSGYIRWSGPLINSRAVTGNGYLSRQISRRYSAGVEYRLRHLIFPGYEMQARTYSILSFHQFAVSANSSLLLYGGPEYARTRGQTVGRNTPANSVSWSPAAGAIYTWSGMHHRVQAGYRRQVTDGGGLQGVVRLNAGWLRLGRQLGRHWTAEVGSELGGQSMVPARPGNSLRMLRAGGGFERELGRNLSLHVSYDRLYQTGSALGYRPGNHNRVAFSIEKSFMRPLGR